MKKIITSSPNLTIAQTTTMMIAPTVNIKSIPGEVIKVDAWIRMHDTDNDRDVLVIKDPEGVCYGTISNVFIDAFLTAAEVLGAMEGQSITVVKATSKSGRDYFSLMIN
nr:MAG TPA: ssDNA binding protein [Caudoviricetes sp.]